MMLKVMCLMILVIEVMKRNEYLCGRRAHYKVRRGATLNCATDLRLLPGARKLKKIWKKIFLTENIDIYFLSDFLVLPY